MRYSSIEYPADPALRIVTILQGHSLRDLWILHSLKPGPQKAMPKTLSLNPKPTYPKGHRHAPAFSSSEEGKSGEVEEEAGGACQQGCDSFTKSLGFGVLGTVMGDTSQIIIGHSQSFSKPAVYYIGT